MTSKTMGRFRAISLLEGLSYVVLLAIAMPLKYLADLPEIVTHVGRLHGGLFMLFVIALVTVSAEHRWKLRTSGIALLAAILPLGAFWLERAMRRGEFPGADA
jgi:integral membrane protein